MKVTSLMSTTAGVICLITSLLLSLLLHAVAEGTQGICSSFQFRHSNGSCQPCQSVVCLPGYEPTQQPCGNGRPLDGDGCITCDSNHFSATGAKCIGCGVCTRREVAIRCNGVNDTVCGKCKAGYFEENGRCISCSHHLNPEDSHDCASSRDVTEQMKDFEFAKEKNGSDMSTHTGPSPSKSGESPKTTVDGFAHNATHPVVYISLMLVIVLLAVVLILYIVCCCCPCKNPDQTQQNEGSAPGQQQEVEVNIGEGDHLLVDNQAPSEDVGLPENVRVADNPAPLEDVDPTEDVRGHPVVDSPPPPEDFDHLKEVIVDTSSPGSDERRETDSNNTLTPQGGSSSENKEESQPTSSSTEPQLHWPSAIESPEGLVADPDVLSDDNGGTYEVYNPFFDPESSSF